MVKNRFATPDGPIWQFGQVHCLSMFLMLNELMSGIFPLIFLVVPLLETAREVSDFIDDNY